MNENVEEAAEQFFFVPVLYWDTFVYSGYEMSLN